MATAANDIGVKHRLAVRTAKVFARVCNTGATRMFAFVSFFVCHFCFLSGLRDHARTAIRQCVALDGDEPYADKTESDFNLPPQYLKKQH
jgi:hypothetical protein